MALLKLAELYTKTTHLQVTVNHVQHLLLDRLPKHSYCRPHAAKVECSMTWLHTAYLWLVYSHSIVVFSLPWRHSCDRLQ